MRSIVLALLAIVGAGAFRAAVADGAPTAGPAPATQSMLGYGDGHAECRSWSDGCAVCLRQGDGEPGCSTPGIACLPKPVACLDPEPAAVAAPQP
jgi:hypothetical protein